MQDRCRPISDSVTYSPVGKPDIPPSSLSSQAAEDQTSTAEKDIRPKTKNTSRFRLLSEKSTRQAPRGTNKTTDLPLKSDGKLRASSPVEDETAYDILRRCSQCGIVYHRGYLLCPSAGLALEERERRLGPRCHNPTPGQLFSSCPALGAVTQPHLSQPPHTQAGCQSP